VMLAVLDGPTIGDALAGCVVNLINGEAWTAIRGQGAWRLGEPIRNVPAADQSLELVALESTPRALDIARGLVQRSGKIRILGSMALAIAHTASGSFDAFCAPVPVRVFDMAASLLVLKEAGGVATDLKGRSLASQPAQLESRTSLVCARNPELHAIALRALAGG
jgi:myo-inositol-1(or 4)-monophosphatase